MSNVYQLSPEQRRYREASVWVTKLDRGLTLEEEAELKAWVASSDKNRERFLMVARQWDEFSDLSRLAELFPESSSRERNSRYAGWAIAASLLLTVLVGFFAIDKPDGNAGDPVLTAGVPASTFYETAIGEQSTVILEDGSSVVLNTNTRLSVHFSKFHRSLTLERGEMHVDVAPDSTRPLTVFAAGKMVQAVGTSFGVEIRDKQDIEVVVTEGKVRIAVRPQAISGSANPQAPVLPTSSLTVAQGEEVRLGPQAVLEVRDVSEEEIDVRLAWRDGDLVFRGERLSEAIEEVSRYTTIEFVFVNEHLKEERVLGRFKAGDVDGLLATLSENLSIAYERTDDGRVLLSSL